MLTLKVSNCLKHTQGRLPRDGTHLQGAHTAGEQSLVLLALLRCVQSMLDFNQVWNGPELLT